MKRLIATSALCLTLAVLSTGCSNISEKFNKLTGIPDGPADTISQPKSQEGAQVIEKKVVVETIRVESPEPAPAPAPKPAAKPAASQGSIEKLHLKGDIGPYPIIMDLTIDYDRARVTGRYKYLRFGTWFTLDGTVDSHSAGGVAVCNVEMEETTPKGNHTGWFDVSIHPNGYGRFTNSKGEEFEVQLTPR